MDWFGTTLKILQAGLGIWADERANKYLDQIVLLKRQYEEEIRKPLYVQGMDKSGNYRSDVVIEHCTRQLRLIGDSFVADAARKS